jgi:hypothetical protein
VPQLLQATAFFAVGKGTGWLLGLIDSIGFKAFISALEVEGLSTGLSAGVLNGASVGEASVGSEVKAPAAAVRASERLFISVAAKTITATASKTTSAINSRCRRTPDDE